MYVKNKTFSFPILSLSLSLETSVLKLHHLHATTDIRCLQHNAYELLVTSSTLFMTSL